MPVATSLHSSLLHCYIATQLIATLLHSSLLHCYTAHCYIATKLIATLLVLLHSSLLHCYKAHCYIATKLIAKLLHCYTAHCYIAESECIPISVDSPYICSPISRLQPPLSNVASKFAKLTKNKPNFKCPTQNL